MISRVVDEEFALWAFGDIWYDFLMGDASAIDLMNEWNRIHGAFLQVSESDHIYESMQKMKAIWHKQNDTPLIKERFNRAKGIKLDKKCVKRASKAKTKPVKKIVKKPAKKSLTAAVKKPLKKVSKPLKKAVKVVKKAPTPTKAIKPKVPAKKAAPTKAKRK